MKNTKRNSKRNSKRNPKRNSKRSSLRNSKGDSMMLQGLGNCSCSCLSLRPAQEFSVNEGFFKT